MATIKVRIDAGHPYSRPEYKEITVKVDGEVTDCMQMRFVNEGKEYTVFECGLDVLTTDTGEHYIVSTVGICARNFLDFAINYIKYRECGHFVSVKKLKEIIFCDDPIHEDRENAVIDDERLLFGLQ